MEVIDNIQGMDRTDIRHGNGIGNELIEFVNKEYREENKMARTGFTKTKRGKREKTKEKRSQDKGLNLATWNIRALSGKENELVREFEQADLDVLAVTETKKKGQHNIELEGGHIMVLSGVEHSKRAQGGVGCIVKKNIRQYLTQWTYISERILKIELNLAKQNRIDILILYGPNDDDKTETKDKFWEHVVEIVEDSKGKVIILGDLNGRVGNKDEKTGDILGIHGEKARNNNGFRIIDFCIQNNLLVMNSFLNIKTSINIRERSEAGMKDL